MPELTPKDPIPSYTTVSQEDITENPNPYGKFFYLSQMLSKRISFFKVQSGRGDGGLDFGHTIGPIPAKQEEVPFTVIPTTEIPTHLHRNVTVTTKLPPIDGCALPLNPIQESEKLVGYRFGKYKIYFFHLVK